MSLQSFSIKHCTHAVLRSGWTPVSPSVVATACLLKPSMVSRSEVAPRWADQSLGSIVSHQPTQDRAHWGAGTPASQTVPAAGICRSKPAMLGTSLSTPCSARCRPSPTHGRARHVGNRQQNVFQHYCRNILSSFSSECCCSSMSLVPRAMLHVCNLPDCDHQAHTSHPHVRHLPNWQSLALIFGGLSHGKEILRTGKQIFPGCSYLELFWRGSGRDVWKLDCQKMVFPSKPALRAQQWLVGSSPQHHQPLCLVSHQGTDKGRQDSTQQGSPGKGRVICIYIAMTKLHIK